MNNGESRYSVLSYYKVELDGFPLSFQPLYVEYVNYTLRGEIHVFCFQDIYLCLILRNKMGLTFAHLVSEIFSKGLKKIDYSLFYSNLQHFLASKNVILVKPPQHLHTYDEAPISSIKKHIGIIQLPILSSIEDQFSNLKSVYRRHIRSAQKSGVEVEFGLHLFEEFYAFYEAKMQANKAVYDQKNILEAVINRATKQVVCGVARLGNSIEAVILNIQDKQTAYYMWGASSENAHNGSFRLLHWELIKYYHSIGVKSYSLGGYRFSGNKTNKQENLENFKLGFGSKVKDGYHFQWVLKPMYYFFYTKMSLLMQFLKK
jgi:hypothetical protein